MDDPNVNTGVGNCCATPKGEDGAPDGPNCVDTAGSPNDLEGVPGRLEEKVKGVR